MIKGNLQAGQSLSLETDVAIHDESVLSGNLQAGQSLNLNTGIATHDENVLSGSLQARQSLDLGTDVTPHDETVSANVQAKQSANGDITMNFGAGGKPYTLPVATKERLGGIKVGENVNVEEEGTLTVKTLSYLEDDNLPPTSKAVRDRMIKIETRTLSLTNTEIDEICR